MNRCVTAASPDHCCQHGRSPWKTGKKAAAVRGLTPNCASSSEQLKTGRVLTTRWCQITHTSEMTVVCCYLFVIAFSSNCETFWVSVQF